MVTKQELQDAIDKLSASLNGDFQRLLAQSIDVLKTTIIDNLKKSNEELQKKVSKLEAEIINLKSENVEQVKRTEASFQHGRLEQMIISGLPDDIPHEQLENKCISVVNAIKNYPVSARDISACHRVGKNNDTILRFVNRKDVEDCLTNRSKLKDFDRASVGLNPNAKIFVSENLSPYMAKLAFYCRTLKRKFLIDRITTFKGVIKIRRPVGPGNNPQRPDIIGHKQDLENLFPNLDDLMKV